jgi:hypothetical protein
MRRDKGLTEVIFLIGLLLLPLDGYLWGAGLPALLIASALAYGIAWELPRLLFARKVGAADQLAASVALTFVLLCFYLGKSDRAVAQMIERQGQAEAFTSPLWLVNDGVLLALTVAIVMVLLALTTIALHLWQGERDGAEPMGARLKQFVIRDLGSALMGLVVGLGGGAWAVTVATQGTKVGLATWVAMWGTVRLSGLTFSSVRWLAAIVGATVFAGLVVVLGGMQALRLSVALWGLVIASAHLLAVVVLDVVLQGQRKEGVTLLERSPQRPKEAPFYVPWVGFYTLRFVGLVVAFFVMGVGWLWGLR